MKYNNKKFILILICSFCFILAGCKEKLSNDELFGYPQNSHVHKYESIIKDKTCIEDGHIEKVCECGDSYIETKISASHNYEKNTVDPTCTQKGYTKYSCKDCGYSYIDNYDAKGHDFNMILKKIDPTCLDGGYVKYWCNKCQEEITVMGLPLGHDLQVFEGREPTHTLFGYKDYEKCSRCKYTNYEEIPATGHSYEFVEVIAPTCEKKGYTLYKCECGVEQYRDETDAIPHNYVLDKVLKAETCTESGEKKWNCSACNRTLITKPRPLGHDYEISGYSATCGGKGEKITRCSRCDYYNKEIFPAKGHNKVVDKAVPATCESEGLTEGSHCSNCDWIFTTQNVIAPIDHEYRNGSCKKCNATEGLNFELNDLQTGYIVSVGSAKYKTEFVIPSYYNGKPVVEIKDKGFLNYYSNRYTKIILPKTIEKIGSEVFSNCNNLKTIYYDGTIEDWCRIEINGFVLSYCEEFYLLNKKNQYEKLVELVIPDSITKIGNYQFACYDQLEKVNIPSSVVEIGEYAFYRCNSLTSIEIPEGVTSIGNHGFSGCHSLSIVMLPKTLKTIEDYLFWDCESLSKIFISDGVKNISNSAFGFYHGGGRSNVLNVYYSGTIEQWIKIVNEENNNYLLDITLHCESKDFAEYTHSYIVNVIPKTCTEDGYTQYKCECGDFKNTDIVLSGHVEVIISGTEATCTSDGKTAGTYCSECYKTIIPQRVIPAHHMEIIIPKIDPTCESSGLSEGKKCSQCDTIIVPQYDIPSGHKEVIIPKIDPTCVSCGLSEGKKCSVCNKVLVEQKVLYSLNHNFIDHYCEWCSYEEEYVLSFFNDGNRISTQILKYSEEYTIPDVTKIGYRFVEWKKSKNPTYPPIPYGYDYFEYYAVWIEQCTLSFDLDGGSAINPIDGYTTDYQLETLDVGSQRFIPYDAEKQGFIFINWSDQDGNNYSKGDSFDVNSDMTFKANYISLTESYKSNHVFNFQDYNNLTGHVKIASDNEYFDKYDLDNVDILKQYGYTKAKVTINIPVECLIGITEWKIKVLIDGLPISSLAESGRSPKTVVLTYSLDLKYCDDYKEDKTNDIIILYGCSSDNIPWYLGYTTIEIEYQK